MLCDAAHQMLLEELTRRLRGSQLDCVRADAVALVGKHEHLTRHHNDRENSQ